MAAASMDLVLVVGRWSLAVVVFFVVFSLVCRFFWLFVVAVTIAREY